MKLSDDLIEKLVAVRRRIAWNRRLKRLAEISCMAAGVAFCYMIASRFAYLGEALFVAGIILAIGIVAGFAIAVFRSASVFQAALAADRKCSLAERVSTAYTLKGAASLPGNDFAAAVVADANKAAPEINPGLVEPVRVPGAAAIFGITVVIVFALALIPATYARERRKEIEKNKTYALIRVYLGQAGAGIKNNARNRKLLKELRETAKTIEKKADSAALSRLARTVAGARKRIEEKRKVIKHFENSRLLANLAQVLKMGIPARSREAAERVGRRLRANPRPALRTDTARTITRLLKQLKEDSELRRNLAEAEAALEAGDISVFEDALARIGSRFTSDLDEQAVSLAEAVVMAANMRLEEAGEPGILVGSPGSAGKVAKTKYRAVRIGRVGAEEPVPAIPVETVNIPERFRPVVQKYFARRAK